jgi:hypothetical protein
MQSGRAAPADGAAAADKGGGGERGGGERFPANREIIREFLEISHDCGLFARFLEPIAEWIQRLAADSLFLPEPRIFRAGTGISSCGTGNEQGIRRVQRRRALLCESANPPGGRRSGGWALGWPVR